ncbi:hypothetical protein [Eubacterium sp. An11]|uniref:hypothetical protein n=1 Tax=Eubacterium sp. An11 TaxID=1965542 RepID=UPI0013A60269|nr:hypothetical protein [Eubacterium sp. An11]
MKKFSHDISETRCQGSLPGAGAPVSSIMAERHMPASEKKFVQINLRRIFFHMPDAWLNFF